MDVVSDVAFQVRLDSETHRRWRVKAAELGYSSLAELVRAAVENHLTPVSRITGIDPTGVSINSSGELAVEGRVTTAPCPKRHVAGVYCKYCGVTP